MSCIQCKSSKANKLFQPFERRVKLFFYTVLKGSHTLLPTFLNGVGAHLLICICLEALGNLLPTPATCWILYASSPDEIYCLNTISMHLYIFMIALSGGLDVRRTREPG